MSVNIIMRIVKIILVTLLGHLLASTILCTTVSGLLGLLGGLYISIFGCVFIPVEMVFFGIAGSMKFRSENYSRRKEYCLCCSIVIAIVFSLIGPKEDGSQFRWAVGYFLGALIPGFLGLMYLTSNRIERENDTASPQV